MEEMNKSNDENMKKIEWYKIQNEDLIQYKNKQNLLNTKNEQLRNKNFRKKERCKRREI